MIDRSASRRPRLVSVVVPTKDAATTVLDQLRALAAQTYEGKWEIVIADNGSQDETVTLVETAGRTLRLPPLRVVRAEGPENAAYARNAGVEAAGGDFLALCDADDVVTPEWLRALVHVATRADLVGGWLNTEPLNGPATRSWRSSYPRDQLPRKAGFLPHVQAADLGVWRDVFLELDGFDTELDSGEDVDFCWRAQLGGFRLAFAPAAEVWYRHRTGIRGLWHQFREYGRADVELALRYRDRGLSTSRTVLARRALWLLVRLPYLLSGTKRRGIWIRVAAQLTGTLERCVVRRHLVGIE